VRTQGLNYTFDKRWAHGADNAEVRLRRPAPPPTVLYASAHVCACHVRVGEGAGWSRGSASACAVTGRGPTTSRRSSGEAAARLPSAASSPRRTIRNPKTRARRFSSRGGIAFRCASNSHRYSEPSVSLFLKLVPLFRNFLPIFRAFVPLLFFRYCSSGSRRLRPARPQVLHVRRARARLRRVRRRLRRRCASGRYPRAPSAPPPHLRRD
jgi:hypothetical protein